MRSSFRRLSRPDSLLRPTLALLLAAALWLPALHLFFRPKLADFRQPHAIAPEAQKIAARHLHLWEDPALRDAEIANMRRSDAEWDFMGRTFLVLSLANMSLDDPASQPRYLAVCDAIIDETLHLEQTEGMYFFLMDYARLQPFIAKPPRSTFLDGEIALMLAARQMVQPEPRYAPLLSDRVDKLVDYLSRGPVMCGESYPDECWLFCNALAVAAIRLSDRLDGRDHSAFIQKWLTTIKAKLIPQPSGLLISRFTYDGQPIDGPEGSSLWTILHVLQLVDPDFAAAQYKLARQQLGKEVLGFAVAREWPPTWPGTPDVDSGPIVPILGASAGSSGQAILAAATFHDDAFLRELLTSLQFAGFPIRDHGRLRYAASNQVGDAVLLYALVQGPLWQRDPTAGDPPMTTSPKIARLRFSLRAYLRRTFLNPRTWIFWAATFLLLLAIVHLLGWRSDTAILCGTFTNANTHTAIVRGLAYVLAYFLSILISPILLLAAALTPLLSRLTTSAPNNSPK